MNKSFNKLTKWLQSQGLRPERIQLSFPEGIKNGIRINIDYKGPYPGPEQFNTLNSIRNHVHRFYKDLTVEQRGHYTAIYIY